MDSNRIESSILAPPHQLGVSLCSIGAGSEVRGQKSEVSSVLCLLFSVLCLTGATGCALTARAFGWPVRY